MSKDTFWIIGYKGHYIHGHYDRDLKREVIEVQWMFSDKGFELYTVRSLLSAKRLITKKLKELLK